MAAVIRREDGWLLLVEQRGPEDLESSWALPAGQIEPGESPIEPLVREVREETGLVVVGSPRLLFTTTHAIADVGEWGAATFLCETTGDFVPDDPDRLVMGAGWHDPAEVLRLLARLAWYDTEPLRQWLSSAGSEPDGPTCRTRRPAR